ncbi:hypothetical protein ACFQYP_16355 [Nonomuraea antimicrobica]
MRRTTSVDVQRATRVGRGRCFGTFGELIQGALPPDGRDFLVTIPVARWSYARFAPSPAARCASGRATGPSPGCWSSACWAATAWTWAGC